MALEQELETYRKKLPELKAQEGKYALVHGDDVAIFLTYEDALKEGYQQFKLEPFLVKRIASQEPMQTITRLLHPQCLTSRSPWGRVVALSGGDHVALPCVFV